MDITDHAFYDDDIESVEINGDKLEFCVAHTDMALLFNESDVIAMARHFGLYVFREEA
jgi:hypothetical protein